MNQVVRPLLSILAIVWLALGMSVPASAWAAHDAAHGATQVSVDAHHHHNDDGTISVHDHDDGDSPDGGHDHILSILLGAIAIPDAAIVLNTPVLERTTFTITAMGGVERHSTGGLRRPPRHG